MNAPARKLSANMESETSAADAAEILVFGQYRLDVRRRQLLRNGERVRIGSRAIALLIVLAQRAGEVVNKRELQKRVWPDVVVEEGTVRVQVAYLQKTLGECEGGGRHVDNVTGQGYRLVLPVTRLPAESPGDRLSCVPSHSASTPPAVVALGSHIIGRASTITRIAGTMPERRLVTLTGPGGIGKTTVALGVMAAVASQYPHGVYFVDLASVTEAPLVPSALAASLHVASLTDPLPAALAFLRERVALLVIDNCEHLIDAVANLTQTVLAAAPQVHILATSREPLYVAGERIHRLGPLDLPPEGRPQAGAALLTYSAVRLFVERARASADVEFDDDSLLLVVELCRRLGGNPLAIEITAARVDLLGLKGLAANLLQGLHLSLGGSRVAAARHRTLRKTLDWSYELLSPHEQVVFRRLAVFSGAFDLPAAAAVVADAGQSTSAVFESLFQLAAKSLLVIDATTQTTLYRLLDTPRAYALEKLRESGELEVMKTRHVDMWCTVGASEVYSQIRRTGADWTPLFNRCTDDLRGAIQWCFSDQAQTSLVARLRLFSLWFEFILAAEYAGWQQWKPIAASLEPPTSGFATRLAAVLDELPQHIKGQVGVLTVAQQVDARNEDTALWSLWIEHLAKRDFRVAINISEAFQERLTGAPDTPVSMLDSLLAVSHHYAGHMTVARYYAERALQDCSPDGHIDPAEALRSCHTRTVLARTLWMLGFPQAAMAAARRGVIEGQASGNVHLRCLSLLVAIAMANTYGYEQERNRYIASLREHTGRHALEYFQLWVSCLDALANGRIDSAELQDVMLSPDPLQSSQYIDLMAAFSEDLVSQDSFVRAEHGRCGWITAEILRVKAERLLQAEIPSAVEVAEGTLQNALAIARQQGSLAWELRVAISLARLWKSNGRHSEARDVLTDVYGRYTEGFQTTDLSRARELLQAFGKQLTPTDVVSSLDQGMLPQGMQVT